MKKKREGNTDKVENTNFMGVTVSIWLWSFPVKNLSSVRLKLRLGIAERKVLTFQRFKQLSIVYMSNPLASSFIVLLSVLVLLPGKLFAYSGTLDPDSSGLHAPLWLKF